MNKDYLKHIVRFLLLSVFFSAGMLVRGQVPYVRLDGSLPIHFWSLKTEKWWYSEVAGDKQQDKFIKDYGLARVPEKHVHDTSFVVVRADAGKRGNGTKEKAELKRIPRKKLKESDRIYWPQLFGLYLLEREGRFGLITAKGNIITAPVYDQIVFLYGNEADFGTVIMPMLLVYKGGKYALMDPTGFLVTRFCDSEDALPSAYIVGAANEFKITDTIQPDKIWGF